MRWEYKCVQQKLAYFDWESLMHELDKEGKAGWELISIQGDDSYKVFIFKRMLSEE